MASTEGFPVFPSVKPVNTLTPFRMFCQKVLPAVYDDSLSYYELLCKVVVSLNTTMGNVNDLNDNFNTLYDFVDQMQQWVNDYFKNLDVQDEIDNKLDQMVEDGTFDMIFAKYTPFTIRTSAFQRNEGETDDTAKMQRAIDFCLQTEYINVLLVDEYLLINGTVYIFNEKPLAIRGVMSPRFLEPLTVMDSPANFGFHYNPNDISKSAAPMFVIGKTKNEEDYPDRVRIKKGLTFENLLIYNDTWNSDNQMFLNQMDCFEVYSTSVNFENMCIHGGNKIFEFPFGSYTYNGVQATNYVEDMYFRNIYCDMCTYSVLRLCQSDGVIVEKIWCVNATNLFQFMVYTYLCNSITLRNITFGASGTFDYEWAGTQVLWLTESNGTIDNTYAEMVGASKYLVYLYSNAVFSIRNLKSKFDIGGSIMMALNSRAFISNILQTSITSQEAVNPPVRFTGNGEQPNFANVSNVRQFLADGTKVKPASGYYYVGIAGMLLWNGIIQGVLYCDGSDKYRIVCNGTNDLSQLFDFSYASDVLTITSDYFDIELLNLVPRNIRTGSEGNDKVIMANYSPIQISVYNGTSAVDLSNVQSQFVITLAVI